MIVRTLPDGRVEVFLDWCGECLQGVEFARWVSGDLWSMQPCGHVAPFYIRQTEGLA